MDNPENLSTYDLQDEEKQNKNHNTTCIGHHYTQTLTLNKTWVLLQTTGGKDEVKIVFYSEIVTDILKRNSERKNT